jgi:hypothetical protein
MTERLLLPFQHGLNVEAIEQAVRLAKSHNATLVSLSLIPMSEKSCKKGARLELVQQSKDFLETVKYKAHAYSVSIETVEAYTHHALQSINMLVNEMQCDGIALFLGYKGGMLLPSDVIGRLVEDVPCRLYIMRLPLSDRKTISQKVRVHLARWKSGKPTLHDPQIQARDVLTEKTQQAVEA